MKKIYGSEGLFSKSFLASKFLKVMKISVTLLFLAAFQLFAGNSYAQSAKLSLNMQNATIENILDEIEQQSEFYFVFNYKLVDVDRKLDILADNQQVSEVQSSVFSGSDVEYVVLDRQILLSPKEYLDDLKTAMQPRTLSGTVTGPNGEPLQGATVTVKGTSIGSITNSEGKYSLTDVPENAILIISYVGMRTQEIPIESRTTIDYVMEEDVMGLDEVVVIGYGTQKKSSITGAIATMASEEVENIPVPNLSNALAGRISGVYVEQKSGVPGYAAEIRVRSVNTWKSTGNAPLYVIDGVIADKNSFDAMDYSEVENITVLKDAASGAIYGARGANGVILVTTKTGKAGKFRLDYNYSYSFDQPSKLTDYQTSGEAVLMNNYANAVAGNAPFADEQEVAYYMANDPAKDYFDKAYNDPVLQKHSLTGSGGTENVRYFVGASYFDQSGFIETTGFNKYNIRTNLDIDFTDELSGVFKFAYNEGVTSRLSVQEDLASTFEPVTEGGNLMGRLQYYMAFTRPTTTDGKYIDPGWIGNPLAFVQDGGTNTATNQNTDMLIGLNYKVPFAPGLTLSAKFSRNYSVESIKHFEVKPTVYQVVRERTNGRIYMMKLSVPEKHPTPAKKSSDSDKSLIRVTSLMLLRIM